MSFGFSMEVSTDDEPESYTVHSLGACRYIVGSVPISDLAAICKGKRGHVMDNVLARHYGASIFFGPKKDVEVLRKEVEAFRNESLEKAIANGEDVAQAWLKYGDVGASSSFMCKALSGLPFEDSEVYAPADYDDFQRCEKMLDIVPGLREKVSLLSTFPCYSGLAKSWDQLSAMHQLYRTNKSGWPSKDQSSEFQNAMRALQS